MIECTEIKALATSLLSSMLIINEHHGTSHQKTLLSRPQEPGSAFLQGSLPDFGLMGARTAQSEFKIKDWT